jgi:hypothetical protein
MSICFAVGACAGSVQHILSKLQTWSANPASIAGGNQTDPLPIGLDLRRRLGVWFSLSACGSFRARRCRAKLFSAPRQGHNCVRLIARSVFQHFNREVYGDLRLCLDGPPILQVRLELPVARSFSGR